MADNYQIKVRVGDLHKELRRMAERIGESSERVESNVHTEMQIIGNDLVNKIKLSMRNTPKANYFYKRGQKRHYPSKKGNPPAVDSGDLINSIIFDDPKSLQVEIGSTMVHGRILEESKKLNRKWLMPAYEENEDDIVERIMKSASAAMDGL